MRKSIKEGPMEGISLQAEPFSFLWIQLSPPLLSKVGIALTNASEVELSCGHGDLFIRLIV